MADSIEIEHDTAQDIPHDDLRSAIEFAVLVAEEANKGKRSLPFPKELRSQFGVARIPTRVLGRLRRSIEGDPTFRERISAGAAPELVDPIGMLWLQRPSGWEGQIRALLDARATEAEDAELRRALKRSEKRRAAAEQLAIRTRATIVEQSAVIESLRSDLDSARADLVKADDAVTELRTELIDVRNEARHARDREAALRAKIDADPPQISAVSTVSKVSTVSEQAAAEPPPAQPVLDVTELGDIAEVARQLGDRLDAVLASIEQEVPSASAPGPIPARTVHRRRALVLPGGVIASSAAAAEFLLRSGAVVIVDGYNVAKLGWPAERLDEQRRRLIDRLENAARRFGADVTVIFDGSTVVGAHADRRRMVRVMYSPEGVIADDLIRDEVRRLPATRAVVVVTNDAEIVADVRALGANAVPSNALLAVL